MTDLQKRLKRKFQRKPSSVASSDSDNLILSPMISGKQSPVILHTTKSYSKENFQRRETIDGGFLNNLDEGRPISTQVNVDKDTGRLYGHSHRNESVCSLSPIKFTGEALKLLLIC